jgi:hypothetical protein
MITLQPNLFDISSVLNTEDKENDENDCTHLVLQ